MSTNQAALALCFICGEPLRIGEQIVWTELTSGGPYALQGPDGPRGVTMHFDCQAIVDEDGERR